MNAVVTDPKWAKLLSLTAHELRSPLTVVGGYIRMLLKESAGPLNDQQRRLLEEAEKSCGRLSGLLGELSALGHLEAGTAPFNRGDVDLQALLSDAIASLPELHDRSIAISLTAADAASGRARLNGDAVRLKSAFAAILVALRRELVSSDRLSVHLQRLDAGIAPTLQITVGDSAGIERLAALTPDELTTFDEWRGGNGLGLPNARRIIERHGGSILSPAESGSSSVLITLPAA
jgi:signal transduction histidine kinase